MVTVDQPWHNTNEASVKCITAGILAAVKLSMMILELANMLDAFYRQQGVCSTSTSSDYDHKVCLTGT